jgi:hypothetical protein
MPYSQYSTRTTVTGSATELQIVEGGILQSVMSKMETEPDRLSWVYVELWLVSTDTPTPTELAQLAAGYLGRTQAVNWFGAINLEPTYAIQTRIWSNDAHSVRTSFLVARG